jgi:hypothetical protein
VSPLAPRASLKTLWNRGNLADATRCEPQYSGLADEMAAGMAEFSKKRSLPRSAGSR